MYTVLLKSCLNATLLAVSVLTMCVPAAHVPLLLELFSPALLAILLAGVASVTLGCVSVIRTAELLP